MTATKPSEPKNKGRRFWPWVLTAFGIGILVAGGACIVLQAAIAGFVEEALHAYAARYGMQGLSIEVRQITPWHAEIQSVGIGGAKSDDRIRLDRLSVDYSLSGLRAHEIEGIVLNGLYLQIEKDAEGWALTGLPPRLLRAANAPDKATPQHSRPVWGVNRLEIRNSRLEIRQGEQYLSMPFVFQAQAVGETKDHYQGQLVCHPGAQTIRTAFDLDLAQRRLTIEGEAEALDLRGLSQILAPEQDPALNGRLAAAYQARLLLDPPSLETAAIDIRLPGRLDLAPAVSLRALDPQSPLAKVMRNADHTWTLQVPGIALTTPDQLRVTDLEARLVPGEDQWRWTVNSICPCDHGQMQLRRASQRPAPIAYR